MKYQPGTPIIVEATANFYNDSSEEIFVYTAVHTVTPPVYCYDTDIQLRIMLEAIIKVNSVNHLRNRAITDNELKEILDDTQDIQLSYLNFINSNKTENKEKLSKVLY